MSTGLRIRPATVNDAAGIAHVNVNGWQTAYRGVVAADYLNTMSLDDRRQRWREFLAHPQHYGRTYVAEHSAAGVVGYVDGGVARPNHFGAEGEIRVLYVHSNWRGVGIGRGLVRALADGLEAWEFAPVFVWVLRDNPYRGFYERLGGRYAGHEPTRLGRDVLVQCAYLWRDAHELAHGAT